MILQYKGFKNNWCYEEAPTIVWANVWLGKETRDYRKGGLKNNFHLQDRAKHSEDEQKFDLDFVVEMHKAIDQLIQKETNCSSEIVYLIGEMPFEEMENVCVVMLHGKDIDKTYVFTKGVYILNNSGGTVQKIA